MSFGCVHVPDFAVQAVLRFDRAVSFKNDAVAVLDGPESLLKVFCSNQAARRAGVDPGMTKLQAEACPGIVLRRRSTEQEVAAQRALLDCGYGFSPRVESTAPGSVILDLTGTERLFGSQQKIAKHVGDKAESCGFQVNVALAQNADTALYAARGFPGTSVIAAGEEAVRLGCLPIEVLQPSAEVLDTLDSWGIRDLKSLSGLPVIPLAQRLGQYGLQLQQLARGEVVRNIVPAQPDVSFEESIELEEPVELLEPLAVVLNRLLEQVMARLMARALATDHVAVTLELQIHSDRQLKSTSSTTTAADKNFQRTLKIPVATQDTKLILKLLQLDLAAHPPHAPVRKIRVQALPAQLRPGQAGLFQPQAPEPAKLEITMARLRAVVGEKDEEGRGLVGFARVLDTHKPDSFEVMACSATPPATAKQNSPSLPKLALRRFRPPLAARVAIKSNVPSVVTFSGMKARVTHAGGPWRKTGSWWDQNREWQRDEWDIEMETKRGVAVYRMFRDLQSGQWFVEGLYD
ncbi:MAG TPA: DNA polymerase Y family protein [Candidatus Angelobacter sp.]|nr:DNA polymerase Y family protein [Candidatus Angelobacter sp.]